MDQPCSRRRCSVDTRGISHACVSLFVYLTLSCLQCFCQAQNASTVIPVNDTLTTVKPTDLVTATVSSERVPDTGSPPTSVPFLDEVETFLPTDSIDTASPDQPRDTDMYTVLNMDTEIVTELAATELITELDNISSTEIFTRVRSLCCPIDYTDVNGSCYMFHFEEVSFEEAREMCQYYDDGSLAKAEPVMDFTSYLFDELQYYSEVERIWIGLIGGENDSYTWLFDDTMLNESNWAAGQPSPNMSLNCSTVNSNGTWEFQPCEIPNLPFMCQTNQVYCGELTTAPQVTTDEYTTPEVTFPTTKATTKRAPTTRPTTPPPTRTTKRPPKPSTTIDTDDDATTEEITERVTEAEEFTTEEPTKPTTKKTTTVMVLPTAPSTSMASTRAPSMETTPTGATGGGSPPTEPGETVTASVNGTQPSMTPDAVTDRVAPPDPTGRPVPTVTPTTRMPAPMNQPLSTINIILISVIVLFSLLAILIGLIIVYLLYKRKQAKKGVYDVDGTELDDIKSVEDIAGPSTGSDGASDVTDGIANTSFVNDELPGFSGGYFNGLRGKTFSYDVS